jgi:hypothetical protein
VELEICGVNTAFSVFDENIDQDKRRLLSSSLRANGGDEEAGLDNEEEENNGEDIPENNQITIYYPSHTSLALFSPSAFIPSAISS